MSHPVAKLSFPGGKHLALGSLLAVAVTEPMLWGGGFDASSRSWFVACAGGCLLAAAAVDKHAVVRAARSPLALALVALALLSVASITWTIGSRAAALRWGLVVGAYAAVFIGSATLTRLYGPRLIMAGIAALAIIELIIGLGAIAFHALPDAERLGRTWRPGGTLEYPPALAILAVGALPLLTYNMAHRRKLIAGGAAAGTALAGSVLGLADSRLGLGLAAAVLLVLILRPMPSAPSRRDAIITTALVLAGLLLGPVLLGGAVTRGAPGTRAAGMAEVAAFASTAGLLGLLARHLNVRNRHRRIAGGICVAAVAVATVVFTSTKNSSSAQPHASPPRRVADGSELLHGRAHEWQAAFETWLDRPLLGAGTGAYYTASLAHQGTSPTSYAHDLPLEQAAELGMPGLLLALTLYSSACWIVIRTRHTSAMWQLSPFILAFLASNLLDWTWHLAGLAALWAVAAGTLSAEQNRARMPLRKPDTPSHGRT